MSRKTRKKQHKAAAPFESGVSHGWAEGAASNLGAKPDSSLSVEDEEIHEDQNSPRFGGMDARA